MDEPEPSGQESEVTMPGVRRARKRPVEVLAIQWTGDNYAECVRFTAGAFGQDEEHNNRLYVYRSRMKAHVLVGTWLVQEPDGSGFYPVTDDNFGVTYEVLTSGEPDDPFHATLTRYDALDNGESRAVSE